MARTRPETPEERRRRIRRIKGDRDYQGLSDAITDPVLREALQDQLEDSAQTTGDALEAMGVERFEDFAYIANTFFIVTARLVGPDKTIHYLWRDKPKAIKHMVLDFFSMTFALGWRAGYRAAQAQQASHRLRR